MKWFVNVKNFPDINAFIKDSLLDWRLLTVMTNLKQQNGLLVSIENRVCSYV